MLHYKEQSKLLKILDIVFVAGKIPDARFRRRLDLAFVRVCSERNSNIFCILQGFSLTNYEFQLIQIIFTLNNYPILKRL